jgi:putative ABC transport system permease protein
MAKLLYWDNLLRSLRAAPGVRAASLANWVPLIFGGTGFVEIEGSAVQNPIAGYRVVSDGYFDAIQMTRFAGRDFGDEDGPTTLRVAVINKAMADAYWPGQSPLGHRVRATSMEPAPGNQPAPWVTVIGVVNDVRHFGYETDPMPEMFVDYRQMPAWRLTGMSAVVRGAGSDGALLSTVRSVIAVQDPTIPTDISLLDDAARRNTASRRFAMSVLSLFGIASLVLAGIGVYGVLSFSVAQRTREMAVRSALGAGRGSIIRLVLTNAGAVVVTGIALGVSVVYVAGRFVESMLFDVQAGDPTIVAAAAIVIFAVGTLAAAVPARRATRADPMAALRNDGWYFG